MRGQKRKAQTRSQHAEDGSVSARTRNARNVVSASASPPSPMAAVPEVCSEDLLAAKEAFHLKHSIMPKKRIKRRRTLQESLTDYQKRILLDRYVAARNRNENVDYENVSTKTVFEAFRGHPEELKKHGDELLKEFYQIYEEHKAQINQYKTTTTSPAAAVAEERPPTGEKSQDQAPKKKDLKAFANILRRLCQNYGQDQEINQLETTTTSPVAAATEVQSPTGEESQEEHEVATPARHSSEEMNVKMAVALQKVKMAETLLKEAQDTLGPVKD